MRQAAADRVAASWGGAQTTAGVLLAIPVETTHVVVEQTVAGRETTRTEIQRNVLYVLPDTLNVNASAKPDYRNVGLYRTPVYLAKVAIDGSFLNRDFAHLLQPKEGREVKWSEARLLVLNSESRALRAVDDLVVGGESAQMSADAYAGSAGISTAVPLKSLREDAGFEFRMKLTLAGSSQLTFLPLARKAAIDIKSTWPHPKFEGAPAPLEPEISDDGFSARWSVLEINRNFRPELVRLARARGPAGRSGLRDERRGRHLLRARGCVPAQLSRRALRHPAHRHHVPGVLPVGAPERQRHSRHAVPDGGPGAGAVLSTACWRCPSTWRSTSPTRFRPARWWR